MSRISWDAASITNYFSNSLGNLKNTTYSSIYNNVGDYKLIKSGKYKKLVSAYYDKLKDDSSSESTKDKTTSTSKDKSTETSSKKEKKNALDTGKYYVKTPNPNAVALDTSKFTSGTSKNAAKSTSSGTNFDATV